MNETIVIKKYSNRRLYDTNQSRYINLEEIPGLLKSGQDLEVRDASSGEDITSTVLLQLIVEREKRKIEGLPVELLKEFIILQDTPAQKFFDMAIKQSLSVLREMKRAGFPAALPERTQVLDPSYWMERFFPKGALESFWGAASNEPPPPPPQEPPPEPTADTGDAILEELRNLRTRLEKIEKERK